ncbi:Uma2 family endonuclease [Nocardia sp. NPDC003693]
MTADPMPEVGSPLPAWAIPPLGGYVADDLDRLPDLPPHTELIDGSLVFGSPQMKFHALVIDLLVTSLRALAPTTVRVRREMTVTLGTRQRPEPDLLIVHVSGEQGPEQTSYRPADVVLAVEVVSPDSIVRDRERKPQLYGQAGIPHFWRVENVHDRAVVYVYELDPATKAYAPTGIHHDRLRLSVPFDIDIDLTEYTRL